MATVENVVAGVRAVFFSVAYPPPQEGFSAQDAATVFAQLDALFKASRAVADPRWLRSRGEYLERSGAGEPESAGLDETLSPPPTTPPQEPRIRRIHMDWRHIEVVAELPWEFIVGGGLVALVTMAERVAGAPPNIVARIAQLSAEQADWKGRRTPAELGVIDFQAKLVLGKGRIRPSRTQIYLGEEDELEGWTA
jgi:hypothetical protein